MDAMMVERWRMLAIRGLVAIAFGMFLLLAPGVGLYVLVLLFGAYSFIDGVFNLATAYRERRTGAWGWLIVQGLLGVAAGVVAFAWPGITAIALTILIGAWAVGTGFAQIVLAIRLRKEIRGEWLLALLGFLSIAFGVMLVLVPTVGAVGLVLWSGAYAVVIGALLVALAFRLRGLGRRAPRDRPRPTGGDLPTSGGLPAT